MKKDEFTQGLMRTELGSKPQFYMDVVLDGKIGHIVVRKRRPWYLRFLKDPVVWDGQVDMTRPFPDMMAKPLPALDK